MKFIILLSFLSNLLFASLADMSSFQAAFVQKITDEKEKVLIYNGNIVASIPNSVVWEYTKPIEKKVYINSYSVTIVEPEIEQVIEKSIEYQFDFFKILKNAKKIKKNEYLATYKHAEFKIIVKNNIISSISYIDEFDNNVEIIFSNQKQNDTIDEQIFMPSYPLDYDIVRD